MPITHQQIQVRQVTHWQPTWTETSPGTEGTYTFQLILDDGAEETMLTLSEGDADNLFDWLSSSETVFFDTARRVLLFGTRPVGA
ncbi:MAG: hypothetical protein H0U79_08820 [Solirubrobacterales bacterium]|nr:hypothetical protein [Solirubrobacterales bacterium]